MLAAAAGAANARTKGHCWQYVKEALVAAHPRVEYVQFVDGDCEFVLSNGSLGVRSDRSGWETWTYRHDGLEVVFVGL